MVDVNVTPDKRSVFLQKEDDLLGEIQEKLTSLFNPVGEAPGMASIKEALAQSAPGVNGSSGSTIVTFRTDTRDAAATNVSSAVYARTPETRESAHLLLEGFVTPEKVGNAVVETSVTGKGRRFEVVEHCEPGSSANLGHARLVRSSSSLAIDQSHGDVVPPPRVLEGRISDGQRVGVRGSGMVTPTSSWSRPLVRKRTDEAAVVEYGSGASWEVEVIQLDPAEPSVTTTSGRREFSVESVGLPVAKSVGESFELEHLTVDPMGNLSNEVSSSEGISGARRVLSVSEEPAPTLEDSPTSVVRAGSRTELETIHVEEWTTSTATVVGTSIVADDGDMHVEVLAQDVEERAVARSSVSGSLAEGSGENFQLVQPISTDLDTEANVVPSVIEDPLVAPKEPLGAIVQVSVSLTELEAAVERRRRTALSSGAGSRPSQAPRVHFPGAFSLSSLRSGQESSTSLEEVATFATGAKKDPLVTDEVSNSGFNFDKDCFSQMRVLGQFNLGFIIAALETRAAEEPQAGQSLQLFIVDQHASDEKFRFEGLNRDSRIDRQPLVTPHALTLTPAQEQLVDSNLEIFRLNGFDIVKDGDRPPGRRMRVTALPTCKGMVFGEPDILDLLHSIEESEADSCTASMQDASARTGLLDLSGHRALWSATAVPRPAKVWQLMACRACRKAIMIGKALRVHEMERVLSNLGTLQQPWNCPHGRPTLRHLVDSSAARQTLVPRSPLALLLSRLPLQSK